MCQILLIFLMTFFLVRDEPPSLSRLRSSFISRKLSFTKLLSVLPVFCSFLQNLQCYICWLHLHIGHLLWCLSPLFFCAVCFVIFFILVFLIIDLAFSTIDSFITSNVVFVFNDFISSLGSSSYSS